jgi:hypothetical protein
MLGTRCYFCYRAIAADQFGTKNHAAAPLTLQTLLTISMTLLQKSDDMICILHRKDGSLRIVSHYRAASLA